MDVIQALKEQQRLDKEQSKLMQGQVGTLSGLVAQQAQEDMCCRPSIEETVKNLQHRAHESLHEADRLSELSLLLDKHPEVKRILEILHLLNY